MKKSKKPKKAAKVAPRIKAAATKVKKAVRKALRHDTPVDVPAIVLPETAQRPRPYSTTALAKPQSGSLIDRLNAGERVHPAGPAGEAPLLKLSSIETLEEAYDAWLELKLEHAAVRARYAEEAARLEREGEFLLGAVRAAGMEPEGQTQSALATTSSLSRLVAEAEAKLQRARAALENEQAAQEKAYGRAFAKLKGELRGRVARYAEKVRVPLRLFIRPLGATRNIVHLERLSADEAILLLFSLHQTIPTRHGFLFDDSTEDVSQHPPPLYPDEGVAEAEVRPTASALRSRVEAQGQESLPLKGFIPIFVPKPGGGTDFYRLLQRGAVMEVELQDGNEFRSALTKEEAERFAGHLLRLKLSGRADLEIAAG